MKRKRSKKKSIKEKAEKKNDDNHRSCVSSNSTKMNLKIDWEAFIVFFNNTLKKYGSVIQPLKYISHGKKSQLQEIVNEYGTKGILVDAVVNMARSDLCNGKVKSNKFPNGLIGSFAWLTSSEKILEKAVNGYYDNPPEIDPTEEEKRKQAEEERQREAEERRRRNNEIDRQIREEQRRAREEAHAHRATPEELEEIFKNFRLPPLKKGLSPNPSPVREGSSDPRGANNTNSNL